MSSRTARSIPIFAAALAVATLAISVPMLAGPLGLTFGDRSVTVNGSTPGGDVVLFAIAKEPSNSSVPIPMKIAHAVVLHDDQRNGSVVFERQRAIPLIAVWVAVDLASGQWAASGSPGFEPQTIPSEPFAKQDDAGKLRKLSALVPEMDVLLVRPGVGAWRVYAAKTSRIDENGRASRPLQIDVGEMIPLSGSLPQLDSIHQGDILALIEPQSMHFAVVEVGK
ncbi:MAG TPA: hypothetical protein VLC46_00090 [Thermoanaerobaculia bacterium]|jgi:hypothetical protein|nr:hypothetical protein [Thermoanaerobaculia bacterium]